jgi:hypothetical protein
MGHNPKRPYNANMSHEIVNVSCEHESMTFVRKREFFNILAIYAYYFCMHINIIFHPCGQDIPSM